MGALLYIVPPFGGLGRIADIISIDALSAEAQEADAVDAFIVDVPGYEGPLHLLLELSRRQKVDLLKVSMLDLSIQYLGFI